MDLLENLGIHSGDPSLLVAIAVVSFALSFIGAAVGLILGHLRLPLLIAYLGSPGTGAMYNLLISGSGPLSGSLRHLRDGRVNWAALALMGVPTAIGASVAVLIFTQVNPIWSHLVIGVMLVISGVNLIRKKAAEGPAAEVSRRRQLLVEVLIGLFLGALGAITGLMLGSLRLPMMIRYLRMDPKEAVGTNMAVGFLTAAVGAATGLVASGGRLNWLLLAAVVPPTLLGGYLGGWMTGRLTKEAVQKMAGYIVVVTGVIMVGQGAGVHIFKIRTPPADRLFLDEPEGDGWYELDFPDPGEEHWPDVEEQ